MAQSDSGSYGGHHSAYTIGLLPARWPPGYDTLSTAVTHAGESPSAPRPDTPYPGRVQRRGAFSVCHIPAHRLSWYIGAIGSFPYVANGTVASVRQSVYTNLDRE